MLYDALATLMREKPFNSITVTHLVEQAKLGRTTFYRNFDEIEDILRMRCDQTFDELLAYIMTYRQQNPSGTRRRLLKPLLRYFYLHSDIIELLLLANRVDMIQETFRARMQPFKAQMAALQGVAEEYIEYGIAIRTGVITNILVEWVKGGKRQAPDELADALGGMIGNMVTLDQLL
jgi:AcrR family transcriptional regulator